MRNLYPALQPYSVETLDVSGGHSLHVEQCGNAAGIPVIFLHGGPGSGCKPDHRQFFDPVRYRIVLIDQRGCGRSRPFGSVENNTTQLLIDDLNTVRERFEIDQWLLFGGSWGASLALAYAEQNPAYVSGMILRGSFLARRSDVEWFFGQGANRLLPRQWQRFADSVGIESAVELTHRLHEGLFSDDTALINRIALAWEAWSGAVVMFSIDQGGNDSQAPIDPSAVASESAIAKARIELHYAFNQYFLAENELLDKAGLLPRVPTTIVHGARDLTCPAEAAWQLHQAIPGSRLEILRTAGHLSSELAMVDALVRATDEMAKTLGTD